MAQAANTPIFTVERAVTADEFSDTEKAAVLAEWQREVNRHVRNTEIMEMGRREAVDIDTLHNVVAMIRDGNCIPLKYGKFIPSGNWAERVTNQAAELEQILQSNVRTHGVVPKAEIRILPAGFYSKLETDVPYRLDQTIFVLSGSVSIMHHM
jgi:hypothetical protein